MLEKYRDWDVEHACTLQDLGKSEQLAKKMKRYCLSILAVTETHLTGEVEIVLEIES